ncbi:sarcosine oxidase subunit gamma [Mesorhizobium albiziae]|uniref:Sarcosine oxidase subunit gamma n=1 Tax=Neomesorhizobium albiziae TaxID=335020 RepID=A0A1I3UXB9_9HYPH|nr:sarcosine oxidase subunit gamma [Mesorhizobium albiziae]GLS28533.1 sarcosine oxidase subunit gamma [Mesorhizobium albiziae]SFJ87838.1 sarcosine oxidase subunit gamma [Mesorhizobium albiziae]
MVDVLSPLKPVWKPGTHGNTTSGVGVVLTETQPGSIVQVAAWPGQEKKLIAAIKTVTRLALPDGAGGGVASDSKAAFGIAPGKFLIVDQNEGFAAILSGIMTADIGTVTDLSHGRTALRISGPKAEWVLSKFFAIDFSLPAFPVGSGISSVHHDVFAQIQRSGADQFDLYIFRSFARSFWMALGHASEEVGYEVS